MLSLAARASASVPVPRYQPWRECSSQGMYGGLYGAQLLHNLTEFKSNLLSHVWSSFDPSVTYMQAHKRFDPMSPFITCPPHQPLKRYGNAGDGGKLLCDLSQLPESCVIYSLGSNGDYSFEQDALKSSSCEIHTFDCTYDGKSLDPRHIYHKVCIGRSPDPAQSTHFMTWREIMQELGHHRVVDLAKIDIEGHEPAVLAELRYDVQLPRQVVIEMHFKPTEKQYILAPPTPRTPAQMALLFMHMASLGYGVVAREGNIWGAPGCCAEFTFLHVERQWMGLTALTAELRSELLQGSCKHSRTARRQLA